MDRIKIAEKLTRLRKARGETIEEVANAVGISPSALGMYESAQRVPRDEVKEALAMHFQTSVAKIFFS